jgi:hypothetical protein
MPPKSAAGVQIRISRPDYVLIENALVHARAHRESTAKKKKARQAFKHLEEMKPQIPFNERAIVHLGPSEYDTMMESLEFFVSDEKGSSLWEPIFDLWEYYLVEGGHVTRKELEALRRRYGR